MLWTLCWLDDKQISPIISCVIPDSVSLAWLVRQWCVYCLAVHYSCITIAMILHHSHCNVCLLEARTVSTDKFFLQIVKLFFILTVELKIEWKYKINNTYYMSQSVIWQNISLSRLIYFHKPQGDPTTSADIIAAALTWLGRLH